MTSHAHQDSAKRLAAALPHVDTRTLDERVYEQMRDGIMSGAFMPGETLTLRGLATAFGTSLMPVRSAVNRLTVEHAIVALPNRSITVPKLSARDFDEMTEIRVALEPLATRLATANMDAAALDPLEQTNEAMKTAGPDTYFALNRAFHFGIYAVARRPVLFGAIRGAWLRVGPLLNSLEAQQTDLPTVSHDWTIAALKRGDAEDAAASIAADIRSAAHRLRTLIGD